MTSSESEDDLGSQKNIDLLFLESQGGFLPAASAATVDSVDREPITVTAVKMSGTGAPTRNQTSNLLDVRCSHHPPWIDQSLKTRRWRLVQRRFLTKTRN